MRWSITPASKRSHRKGEPEHALLLGSEGQFWALYHWNSTVMPLGPDPLLALLFATLREGLSDFFGKLNRIARAKCTVQLKSELLGWWFTHDRNVPDSTNKEAIRGELTLSFKDRVLSGKVSTFRWTFSLKPHCS